MRNVRARSDQGFQLSSTNNGANDRLTEEAERIKEKKRRKGSVEIFKYYFIPRNVTTGHLLIAHNLHTKYAENINNNKLRMFSLQSYRFSKLIAKIIEITSILSNNIKGMFIS